MRGALDEQGLVDQGTDPHENEGEKALEDRLHDRREIGEVGAWV